MESEKLRVVRRFDDKGIRQLDHGFIFFSDQLLSESRGMCRRGYGVMEFWLSITPLLHYSNTPLPPPVSRQQRLHHVRLLDAGELEIEPLVFVSEPRVVDAEQVQHRRVEI